MSTVFYKLFFLSLFLVTFHFGVKGQDIFNEALKIGGDNFKRVVVDCSKSDYVEELDSSKKEDITYWLCYVNKNLYVFVARYCGPTYTTTVDYCLVNKELYYVYKRTIKTNRPIMLDSLTMLASGDSEVFDVKKLVSTEILSYFKYNRLIQQFYGKDGMYTNSDVFRLKEDEESIIAEYKRILKLFKK